MVDQDRPTRVLYRCRRTELLDSPVHIEVLGGVPASHGITVDRGRRRNRARGKELAAGSIPSYHQRSTGLAKRACCHHDRRRHRRRRGVGAVPAPTVPRAREPESCATSRRPARCCPLASSLGSPRSPARRPGHGRERRAGRPETGSVASLANRSCHESPCPAAQGRAPTNPCPRLRYRVRGSLSMVNDPVSRMGPLLLR